MARYHFGTRLLHVNFLKLTSTQRFSFERLVLSTGEQAIFKAVSEMNFN